MKTVRLVIAEVFSRYPAGRFRTDSRHSGERLREELLAPALDSLERGECLEVEFAGIAGAGTGFLDEAFGGLVRAGYAKPFLDERLRLCAGDAALGGIVAEARSCIEREALLEAGGANGPLKELKP